MEAGKYSLKLSDNRYTSNLYKSTFTHACYFNVFRNCRKQTIFDGDGMLPPILSDFTSVNTDDSMMLTRSFPKSKAFSVASLDDICLKLVQDKKNYKKYFLHCQKLYKRQYKIINDNAKKKRSDTCLPVYMINLCNSDDPDPYLDASYNWYYTGGVLDTICIDNEEYFVGMFGNNLCLRYVNNAKVKLKEKFQMDDPDIFNIRSYSYGNKKYLAIRRKNCLKLIHFKIKKGEVVIREDWGDINNTPYIDFKLFSKDTVGYINMHSLFKSVDLQTQKVLIEHKISSKASGKLNRFCLFDSTDIQNLLFMDREQIKSFDLRSSEECEVLTLETFPMSRCEELCNFIISKNNSNYIFACTSHTITKVDLRNKKIVKQWSHLLSSPPLMVDSVQSGTEYLCISSFKDRVVLCSTPEENNLPRLIPTPMDTFNEVNLEHPVIIEGLNKRLQNSINGLKLLETNKTNVEIHYSNAFGDLFCNEIQLKSIERNIVDNKVAREKMKSWLKGLQRRECKEPKTLYATEIATEWSSIKQLHCKSILEENLAKYKDNSVVTLDLGIDPYEFDMSSIWGSRPGELELAEEPSSVKKVIEWLNRESN